MECFLYDRDLRYEKIKAQGKSWRKTNKLFKVNNKNKKQRH